MARLTFAEIKVMKFKETDSQGNEIHGAEPIVIDHVTFQVAKKVWNQTMIGEKAEFYTVPVTDIPFVFQSDVKFPDFNGFDSSRREASVREFVSKYIGKQCIVEDIAKKDKRILTSIEFS